MRLMKLFVFVWGRLMLLLQVTSCRQQFKDALGLSQPISYQAHEDAKLTPSHNTKARYEL